MELKFRDLTEDEIELRVGSTNDSGFQLLLYKNARIDMQLLDEVVGVGNWQREHYILGNDIYCKVGIYNQELKQWVWRADAGSSGTIEEEKSKASDSFKRACVNFGLGRCLYSAPFVWIVSKDKDGVMTGETKKERYIVDEIGYTDHKITKLVIKNEKTKKVVFSMGSNQKVAQTSEKPQANANSNLNTSKGSINSKHKALIDAFVLTLQEPKRTQFYNWLDEKCHTMSVELLSEQQGERVCKSWKLI